MTVEIDSSKIEDTTSIAAMFTSRREGSWALLNKYVSRDNPSYIYFVWTDIGMDIEWDVWLISESQGSHDFDADIDINIAVPSGTTWNKATLTVDETSFPSIGLTISTTAAGHILGDHPGEEDGMVETVYRVDDMLGRHYYGSLLIYFLPN